LQLGIKRSRSYLHLVYLPTFVIGYSPNIPRALLKSLHIPNWLAMGKSKKRLDDLKKDLKELKKEEMKNIVGGRDKKNRWKRWLNICGNILPQ